MSQNQIAMLPDIFANLSLSAQMEGLIVTEQIQEMCLAILNGVTSLEECLAQLNAKYSQEEQHGLQY